MEETYQFRLFGVTLCLSFTQQVSQRSFHLAAVDVCGERISKEVDVAGEPAVIVRHMRRTGPLPHGNGNGSGSATVNDVSL